jgi:hypothetical protein
MTATGHTKHDNYPRYLSGNAKCEFPKEFIAVDTEAYINKNHTHDEHTLRLGEAIYSYYRLGKWHNVTFSFNTYNEFWDYLDRHRRAKSTLRVIAHNMAYDAQLLDIDHYISSRDMILEQWVLEPYIVKAYSETGSILFLSSTNWFHSSLRDLGKKFGIEKFESPTFDNTVPDNILRPYCAQDTLVLATIIQGYIKWLHDNDMGDFSNTISGQALNAYRHKWMEPKTILLHRYPMVEKIERESYLGGRCECFRLGTISNVYKLDINSMYPYVMSKYQYPCKLLSGDNLVNESTIYDAIDHGQYVIAKCAINMRENAIGVKRNNKLLFPIGKIITSLTLPEIDYIMKNPEIGRIDKIIGGAVYEQRYLFKDYVKYFYHIKSSSTNKADIEISKQLLVSLYGKFGQREYLEISQEPLDTDVAKAMIDNNLSYLDEILTHNKRLVRIGDKIYRIPEKSEKSSINANPAIASAVTAYARCYIDTLIRIAGRKNVYYTDTDSIFCNDIGYNNLKGYIDQHELGKLKMEEWERGSGIYCTDIEIYGPKNYKYLNVEKIKGIRKDAIKIDNNVYVQDQFCTKRSHYSKSHPPGTVIVEHITKHISCDYDKGLVSNNIIIPYCLKEY